MDASAAPAPTPRRIALDALCRALTVAGCACAALLVARDLLDGDADDAIDDDLGRSRLSQSHAELYARLVSRLASGTPTAGAEVLAALAAWERRDCEDCAHAVLGATAADGRCVDCHADHVDELAAARVRHEERALDAEATGAVAPC